MRSDATTNSRRAVPLLIRAATAGTIGLAAVGGVAASAGPAQAGGWPGTTGAVYTMTNSPSGNAIEAYARASDGSLTPAGTYPTGGDGGTLDSGHSIAVSRDGSVVVNVNAGSNSVSAFTATPWGGATSYDVTDNGTVTANGPAVPIDQAAACWLAAAGGFAFTANAGSGSIGAYAVAPGGGLTALGTTLVENDPTSKPLDEGVSAGQNYLYVLAAGLSQIVGYRVGYDGSLSQVTTAPVAAGSAGLGAS